MKKKLAVLLSLTMAVSMLAVGCGSKNEEVATPAESEAPAVESEAPAEESEAPAEEETSTATGALKTGFFANISLSDSTDAGEEDGLAQTYATLFAVTVDSEGKVADCVIDAAQTKINFSSEGKIVTDAASEFKTKNELGDDYGMRKASSIGKEWNEQAQAFADYCVGKTADEIQGISLDAEGKVADADLAASVTVHANVFVSGVVAAINNAQDLGAQAGDKLGLGVSTSISNSKDAADGEDGEAQAYSYYAVSTVDASGKITSCILDASQGKVNFDATGKITSDISALVDTKDVLGEAYGMKKASTIGKEWNEQAAAFAQYCVGKTSDEVSGTAITDDGHAGDADLAASVSVHVGDFVTVVTKAVANAQ